MAIITNICLLFLNLVLASYYCLDEYLDNFNLHFTSFFLKELLRTVRWFLS